MFVVTCIQMGMTRQPLTVNEGIQLMNSLIKETNLQNDVINFQQTWKLGNDGFKYGKVGKGWWQHFLMRNGNKIVTKMGEKYAADRSDWTILKNIEQM